MIPRVSGDFPAQLATRLGYLIGRPAVCCGRISAARLSVCRVVLLIPRAWFVASILVRHIRHARDFVVTC